MTTEHAQGQYRPVVIIGAARSGTNMLRDCLTALPGVGTWPCDEINYIWHHGSKRHPTDEFSPDMATEPVRRYIRSKFDRLARVRHLHHVVEKTCANSLRVAFVDRILPEAKFIFLVRDGRDVVASAMKRWTAPLDLGYVLKKARYVPPTDLLYYASRYLWNRAYRLVSGRKRLAFWGPRFDGMGRLVQNASLPELCAAQWARSVDTADEQLGQLDDGRVHSLRYEDFVARPAEHLQALCDFLDLKVTPQRTAAAAESVSPANVGKWKTQLTAGAVRLIEPHIRDTLSRYHYD
jgi:hypothetical protein